MTIVIARTVVIEGTTVIERTINRIAFSGMFLLLVLSGFSTYAGEIALTFDDAPTQGSVIMSGEERTNSIIRILQNNGIADALFFVNTNKIDEAGAARLKKYSEAGFHLANHSHSHLSARKVSVDEYVADVVKAKQILSGFDNVLPLHRFPYLNYGKDTADILAIQKKLAAEGYKNGYVTSDNYEWYINSLLVKAKQQGKEVDLALFEKVYVESIWDAVVFYDELAKKTIGRSPKHVLLLHEFDTSPLFLDALIKRIKAEGWKIISPQEAYKDKIAHSFPNTDYHGQGRIAAIAHSQGASKESIRSSSESTDAIDALLHAGVKGKK